MKPELLYFRKPLGGVPTIYLVHNSQVSAHGRLYFEALNYDLLIDTVYFETLRFQRIIQVFRQDVKWRFTPMGEKFLNSAAQFSIGSMMNKQVKIQKIVGLDAESKDNIKQVS